MIRYLTERIPVMICPRWVYTRIQPIAIRTVLDYLMKTLLVPNSAGETIEIGGADVITYGEMLTFYAEVRGLRRWLVPVPVLTPKLSSYWVHFVTPIPGKIARPLIAGLRNEIIVRDDLAKRLFPDIQPLDYRTAVKLALEKLQADQVETSWSDALSTSQADRTPVMLTTHEGMIIEHRQMAVDASPKSIFSAFTSLGGARGWLYMNWAWRIRGSIDRLFGGVGLRRISGRSCRAAESIAPARGNESAGESVAAVRGENPGPRRSSAPDSDCLFRPQGASRPDLLVRALSNSRIDLWRYDPGVGQTSNGNGKGNCSLSALSFSRLPPPAASGRASIRPPSGERFRRDWFQRSAPPQLLSLSAEP
jgi:hypothetical protein